MFVLHGNVYDVVVHGQTTSSLVDFLTDVLLKDTRESIAVYNMATGPRFAKRAAGAGTLDDVLGETHKDRVLPALERLLVGSTRAAVILEYAESLAPAGDPTFQADADRSAIIMLHRWSSLPAIEKSDNIVLLVAENLSELAPKIVSNPRVAVVDIPMPDRATRKAVARIADPRLARRTSSGYADITAGLKAMQIASILTPPPASSAEPREREAFIAGSPRGRRPTRRRAPRSSPP